MELALIWKGPNGPKVVETSITGKAGSYRNVGIYGDPGDAVQALQEFQSKFPKDKYYLVDATNVAHKQAEVYKWKVFSDYDQKGR